MGTDKKKHNILSAGLGSQECFLLSKKLADQPLIFCDLFQRWGAAVFVLSMMCMQIEAFPVPLVPKHFTMVVYAILFDDISGGYYSGTPPLPPCPPFPDIHSDILDLSSLDHWTTGLLTPSQSSHPSFVVFF